MGCINENGEKMVTGMDFSPLQDIEIPLDVEMSYETPTNAAVNNYALKMRNNAFVGYGATIQCSKVITAGCTRSRGTLENQVLDTDEDGRITVTKIYSTGTNPNTLFVENRLGPLVVFRVLPESHEDTGYFGFYFEKSQVWCFFQKKEFTKGKCFIIFKRAKVVFAKEFNTDKISKILFSAYASDIDAPKDYLKIAYCAGWFGGVYIDKKNYACRNIVCFSEFPVNHKELTRECLTAALIEDFIHRMLAIDDSSLRLICLIYPVASVLSSYFMRENAMKISLNFVVDEDFGAEIICEFFQILNRKELRPISADLNEKEIKQIMEANKDETVIIDCRSFEEDTDYQKKQSRKNQVLFHRVFHGKKTLNKVNPQLFGLVTISDEPFFGPGVMNLYVSEDSFGEETEFGRSAMNAYLWEVIQFAQQNQGILSKVIARTKQKKQGGELMLNNTCDFCECFWKSYNMNFSEHFQLPSNPDFKAIIDESSYDEEDLLENFLEVARGNAKHFEFLEKKAPWRGKTDIRYTEEVVYFPVGIFEELLRKGGLHKKKNMILAKLKKMGYLKTESGKWIKRLSVEGHKHGCYFISKAFLNPTGEVDIVKLGKGGQS